MSLIRKLAIVVCALAASAYASSFPQRIVSLSPNTTEILYGVNAFGRVVGVSQYCSYPPAVAKLPRVGGWQTSDVEKILALRPDLVVLTKAQEPFIADRLQAFHLHFIAVPSESLADIFTAIQMIGGAAGVDREAAALTRRMHASLAAIRSATDHLPRRSALVVVGRTPGTLSDLYVATQGSYLADLVEIAGGRSVTAAAPTGYERMNKEALLMLNPEVVIDINHRSESKLSEQTMDAWNDLPELRAVQKKQVHPVDDPFVPHPSQFVIHTAEIFEHILHPEIPRAETN